MDCRHRSLILLVVLSGFLFSIAFASIAYAEANVTDPCAGITCNPSSLTCPDGFAATCTNTCSAGTCSSCSPDCSGHQIVDKCAGVICNVVTLTCIDKFVASCTPKCDSATGQCGTCTPDCSGHQGSNSTAVCNNWVREEIEQCDGNDLAGQTCQSRGFVGGTLKCNMGCTFDTSGCTSATAVCGNGVCESGETSTSCSSDCKESVCAQVITYAVDAAGHCQQFSDSCLPPGWTRVSQCPATTCPARIEIKLNQDVYKIGDRGTLAVNAYAPDGTSLSGITYVVKIYVNGVLQSQSRYTAPYTSSGDVSSGSPSGTYVFDLYTDVPNCPSVSSSAKALFDTGGVCGNKICEYNENYNNCPADCIAPTTPTCTQVITPAKNPLTGECKEFSTTCDVPQGWEKVSSCGASTGTGACPLYTEPTCSGYKVSAGRDANGCQLPVTCCGDKVCSGKENEMNCKEDCTGGGTLNCANVVVCMSGDGCCPSGCSSMDKDCGTQLPTGQRCPDGSTVKCGYVGSNYICDPCPILQQNIQQGCRQESDPATGIVRMICNQICPEQQEVIDSQMSTAKQKCIEHNGRPVQRVDGRGCNYIDCEFGTTGPTSPISITPVYCPSPNQIDEMVSKCKSMGIEPRFSFEGGCKNVKCMEQKREGCDYLPEEEWTRMKAICNPKGLAAIKEFDSNGCQVIRCGGQGECSKEPPQEAFEKCRSEGGEMIIKRDPSGCTFSKCIMRGDETSVYVEDITEMPESTELLSIAFKLEELKMTLDQLSKKTDDIANYYKSTGSAEENRFRRVSDMFESAKDKVDGIKTKLRDRINTLTKDDIMEVKRDIKYIKDVMLKDIVYFMLSNSDEVKAIVRQPTTEQVGKEGDCGTDGMCFDRAFRVCKPAIFSPTGPAPGEQGEGPPPGEEPDIYITGLEGDNCIIKIVLTKGGPPAGAIPGVNPPYEMKCKIKDYALGAQNFGPQMFQKYCEGNLLKLINMGQQGGGPSGPIVPGVCSGDMDCRSKCPASAENARKCLDVLGGDVPQEPKQILEDIASGKMQPDSNVFSQAGGGQTQPAQAAIQTIKGGDVPQAYQETIQQQTTSGPCAGCLNNGVCDIGECKDCIDCYGK